MSRRAWSSSSMHISHIRRVANALIAFENPTYSPFQKKKMSQRKGYTSGQSRSHILQVRTSDTSNGTVTVAAYRKIILSTIHCTNGQITSPVLNYSGASSIAHLTRAKFLISFIHRCLTLHFDFLFSYFKDTHTAL